MVQYIRNVSQPANIAPTDPTLDKIFTWSTNLDLILIYFECVCKVFEKYRVSFKLEKCEFLKDRVEYAGHNLTPTGNVPSKSMLI